jgi:hypothetical protein
MTFFKYLRDHIYSILIVLVGMTFVELVLFLDPRVNFHMGTLIYTWVLAMVF